MNRSQLFFFVVAISLAIGGVLTLQSGLPLPAPPGPADLNLVQAFASNPNRAQAIEHAQAFASLCDAFADTVESDGQQTQPRLTTGKQVADLRRAAREIHFGSTSLGALYPLLAPALGQYLDRSVGRDARTLDAATRAKWVQSFRTIAAASRHAAASR